METDLFRTAGEAAEILEQMGYVAVARKRDGVVTLEYRQVVGGKEYMVRHQVDEAEAGASALARLCDAEFRAAVPHGR